MMKSTVLGGRSRPAGSFGEVRVEVQRSTVEPYDRSKADPEEAITESIERLAAARESAYYPRDNWAQRLLI